MESSYEAKLSLLEAALSTRGELTEHYRRTLFEGVFWLLDLLEEEIVARNDDRKDYCLSYIYELKEAAERCFRDGGFVTEQVVMRCCTKLVFCTPKEDGTDTDRS